MMLSGTISKAWRSATVPARSLLAVGLDFVAPPSCPACGQSVESGGTNHPLDPRLCVACTADLAPPVRDSCQRCAAPVGPHVDTSDGCLHCRSDRFAFSAAVSLGTYAGRLQSACLRSKETQGASLASAMTGELWNRHSTIIAGWQPEVVLPVPRFWLGRILFGSNAATIVAETLARRLNIPCRQDLLTKVRWTSPQTSLPATERRRNLRDAFAARAADLKGRRVLLADDVLTTGTTAHRCARVLKDAGASEVAVAVLARGLGRPGVATA
jgi:ComF family protein